jgi:hypothetical protein
LLPSMGCGGLVGLVIGEGWMPDRDLDSMTQRQQGRELERLANWEAKQQEQNKLKEKK